MRRSRPRLSVAGTDQAQAGAGATRTFAQETYRRLRNPHEYKVGLTRALWHEKEEMLAREAI